MKTLFSLIFAIVVFCSHSVDAGSMTGAGAIESYRLPKASYNGSMDRDYKVYVPPGYDRTKQVPMVFALHGCSMDHNDAIDNWNWDLIADEHAFIVVFPFVTDYEEMRGQNCWGYWFPAHIHEGAGEVEDLHRMAMEVEKNYNIDPERRYIIGLSSGGGMAVAAAIAHNEYWAAGASAAGLPYGDWSNSVMSERFKSLQDYVDAIRNELDHSRAIPFMAVNSINDEVVRVKAAELIRDSHMTVFDGKLESAAKRDCTAEGIPCTHTRYANDEGKTVVETVIYNGAVAGTQCGLLGCGHYYVGEDNDPAAWAYATGPSTSQIAWDFFSRHTLSGNLKPEIAVQSSVTDDNRIIINGSATDANGAVVSVEAVLKKRDAGNYEDFLVVPVSEDFDSFLITTQVLQSGVYKVYAIATDNDGATAQSNYEIRLVDLTASSPEVSNMYAAVDRNDVTITGTVADADNDLDRVLVTVKNTTKPAAAGAESFTVRFENLEPGNYRAEAAAFDSLEMAGSGSVDFSIEYSLPPSATGTVQRHCEAGRIPWSEYGRYYLKHGLKEFTIYQMPDGTWDELPPEEAVCFTSPVSEHISQGRAYSETSGWWIWTRTGYYAKGSDDSLGDSLEAQVSLRKSGPDNWEAVDSCF